MLLAQSNCLRLAPPPVATTCWHAIRGGWASHETIAFGVLESVPNFLNGNPGAVFRLQRVLPFLISSLSRCVLWSVAVNVQSPFRSRGSSRCVAARDAAGSMHRTRNTSASGMFSRGERRDLERPMRGAVSIKRVVQLQHHISRSELLSATADGDQLCEPIVIDARESTHQHVYSFRMPTKPAVSSLATEPIPQRRALRRPTLI